jgi:hypothetical protein
LRLGRSRLHRSILRQRRQRGQTCDEQRRR